MKGNAVHNHNPSAVLGAPPTATTAPRQRQADTARLTELLPIEIQGVAGFYLTGDRAKVTKGADRPATFIDPAPRVTAWGVADGEPWYFVHVGPHERIVTKSTLVDGTAWDTFPNVPAAGSRTGREVMHCLIRQLVQLDNLAPSTVATTTGWHDMPEGPVFVTGPAGVAIGAGGPVEMRTQLDQVPDRYGIEAERVADPGTADGRAELAAGWRASVALLDFGPLAVTGAVLGSAYLAPIGNRLAERATFMTWLRATTQSGKSTLVAYVLGHFGTFTADTLPFGYMDSVPATEQGLHVVRDLWAPLDDYRRTGIAGTDTAMDRLADFAIRAVGNGAGRKLLTRDRKRAAPRNPQAGGYLTTAEVSLPAAWESAEGRVFPVELGRIGTPGGLVKGTEAHDLAAEQGAYRAAMAGYLRWLAADLDGAARRYGDARRAQRRRYATEHPSMAGRTWDQLACMWLGWRMWLDYGQAVGATTEAEAGRTLGRVMAALIDQAQHSTEGRAEHDQGAKGFALLRTVLGTGQAHTPDLAGGGVPAAEPAAYGYRRTASAAGPEVAGGFNSGPLYIGGGPAIGRVDLAGGELILFPEATHQALTRAAGPGGLPIPAVELWERWAAAGYTATETETRGGRTITRSTARRRVDGRRERFVVVRLAVLDGTEAEAEPTPEPTPEPAGGTTGTTGPARWSQAEADVSAGQGAGTTRDHLGPPKNTVSGDGACRLAEFTGTEAEAGPTGPTGPTGPAETTTETTETTEAARWSRAEADVSAGQGGETTRDHPRPPENTVSGDGACQVCRVPGPSCGIVTAVEPAAPCAGGCGREVYGVTQCGARREHVCLGPDRRQAAPVRQAAPSTRPAPTGPQRPAQAAGAAPLAELAAEVADWRRAVAKLTAEDDTPPADGTVTAALAAWHSATGGLRWTGWAGDTATSALGWLDGKRGAVARGEAAAAVELAELAELAPDTLLHLDYLAPGVTPEVGQAVTALDVNGQYLAAAAISLGTGAPVHIDRPGTVAPFVKAPGYVRLAAPVDYAHPAMAGQLTAGRVLAMPYVDFLTRRGAEVVAAEVWVWPTGQHRAHLGAWQKLFRTAYNTLRERAGTESAAKLALRMVKSTYTVFLGGWLRSDKNTGRTARRDWSDHIIAESWVRAMVAIERAEAAGGRVIGMRRDSAWFLADTAPIEPAGLTISGDLGKWKIDRWAEVDASIIDAHATGSATAFNLAVKAAHESREG